MVSTGTTIRNGSQEGHFYLLLSKLWVGVIRRCSRLPPPPRGKICGGGHPKIWGHHGPSVRLLNVSVCFCSRQHVLRSRRCFFAVFSRAFFVVPSAPLGKNGTWACFLRKGSQHGQGSEKKFHLVSQGSILVPKNCSNRYLYKLLQVVNTTCRGTCRTQDLVPTQLVIEGRFWFPKMVSTGTRIRKRVPTLLFTVEVSFEVNVIRRCLRLPPPLPPMNHFFAVFVKQIPQKNDSFS